MNSGKMVFAQIMSFASQDIFKVCVQRYKGNYKIKSFSCWRQFLCMAFGQLTHRESLTDTMLCLELNAGKLYHLGIGQAYDKSTLTRANERRDWRIFQDFGLKLIQEAQQLYVGHNQLDLNLKSEIYAIDSTTVDLCLNVFWWANFRKHKGAIKIHTLLDLKTSIPEYVYISDGSVHDVNALDLISFQKNSIYVMDKAYIDFQRLYTINQEQAYFVIRARNNLKFKVHAKRSTLKESGVLCDQDILLKSFYPRKNYPIKLRRVKFYDKESNRIFVFLTNNFRITALTVAELYKSRWQIEIFFKWIKQHLKITTFWGRSENAVKTQVWIAISTYVLVAIAKKKLELKNSPYELLQYVSISPFEKENLNEIFSNADRQDVKELNYIQLKML